MEDTVAPRWRESSASCLFSNAWSRDNLVTPNPARLYTGKIRQIVSPKSLGAVLRLLEQQLGPVRAGQPRPGTFTWDIPCEAESGAFVLQVPLALDEPGARGRSRRVLPEKNVEHHRHFAAAGLTRFITQPQQLLTLGDSLPAALLGALSPHHSVHFARGTLQVELRDEEDVWCVPLGLDATAEVLVELCALLVYHYEPERDGGTALTDVSLNDGDLALRRTGDGAFELRLRNLRARESGIDTDLLLLYLLTLTAYERWLVDEEPLGIPVVISNPSLVFPGVVRGLSHRYRDLGLAPAEGEAEAHRWIQRFGRSRLGRSYRPWVERFEAGELPPKFGRDLRERWWQLAPLVQKLHVLGLRERAATEAEQDASALRASGDRVQRLVDRLGLEIGGGVELPSVNDRSRAELLSCLEAAGVDAAVREATGAELLTHWPFRSWDHLLAAVPSARPLTQLQTGMKFGHVIALSEQGTLASLGPLENVETNPRDLANPELLATLSLPPSLHAAAARTFPSFAAYMDAALGDPAWGYYVHRVEFGKRGHFITHPEALSPHYGAWLADWAFLAWQDMLAQGELSERDVFSVVEFGAGNGRLARDFLDSVAQRANEGTGGLGRRWQRFASCLDYRIYELSASLRDAQKRLLGRDAQVHEGDARQPEAALRRDFPDGLTGLVLSNEVPDAFGVHKVVLEGSGRAFAALVIPRAEARLVEPLGAALQLELCERDRALREQFTLRAHEGERYLDAETFPKLMRALAAHCASRSDAGGERDTWAALLDGLWCEEAYVEVSALPELAAHLRAYADDYATALAAANSGVTLYVNLHAAEFMRGIAASLCNGFVLTIDYGATTWDLVQGARRGDFRFRVYGDMREEYVPRANDPYAAPGSQDMTADVNFSELYRSGVNAGLELIHYGPETDLARERIPRLLDELVLGDTAAEPIAELLGNPAFKVLVLGTRKSDAFASPWLSPEPLTQSADVLPAERRAKLAKIREALANIRTNDES